MSNIRKLGVYTVEVTQLESRKSTASNKSSHRKVME